VPAPVAWHHPPRLLQRNLAALLQHWGDVKTFEDGTLPSGDSQRTDGLNSKPMIFFMVNAYSDAEGRPCEVLTPYKIYSIPETSWFGNIMKAADPVAGERAVILTFIRLAARITPRQSRQPSRRIRSSFVGNASDDRLKTATPALGQAQAGVSHFYFQRLVF
jgi:hypothetical protein